MQLIILANVLARPDVGGIGKTNEHLMEFVLIGFMDAETHPGAFAFMDLAVQKIELMAAHIGVCRFRDINIFACWFHLQHKGILFWGSGGAFST